MATDATGAPTTSLGIPKYNTAGDPPSGKGFNAAMDFIDDLIEARGAPPGASGVKVWNNTTKTWDTPAGADGTKFLRDDGTFVVPTMVRLYDNIAGGAIANWDVSSGLTGFTHLKLVLQARGDTAATSVFLHMRLNNDLGNNYGSQYVRGIAAGTSADESVSASAARLGIIAAASATAGHTGVFEAIIPNYAGTTFFKNWTANGGWTQAITTSTMAAMTSQGVWASTSAINRITILPSAGNFIAGSRLTIYGLQ